MGSPEHLFHPQELFAPNICSEGGASGPSVPDSPQPSALPEGTEADLNLPTSDNPNEDLNTTDTGLPQSNPSLPTTDTTDTSSGGEVSIEEEEPFHWRKNLSPNTQRLYWYLLCDVAPKYLPMIASEEGWDLEVALEELRSHDLLDESEPDFIRLARRQF